MIAAEKDMTKEQKHLASLVDQLNKMVTNQTNYISATQSLHQSLENAMSDFRTVWFDKMKEWHRIHYQYINDILPNARRRNERANECYSYYTRTRVWSWRQTSRIMRFINEVCKSTGEIIMDDAARMDYDSYMDAMKKEMIKSWNKGIDLLTAKCYKFGLNETTITVNHPAMTEKGFSAIITDGTTRIVDIRIIWAAEYSELVTPHTRYIATQKTIK